MKKYKLQQPKLSPIKSMGTYEISPLDINGNIHVEDFNVLKKYFQTLIKRLDIYNLKRYGRINPSKCCMPLWLQAEINCDEYRNYGIEGEIINSELNYRFTRRAMRSYIISDFLDEIGKTLIISLELVQNIKNYLITIGINNQNGMRVLDIFKAFLIIENPSADWKVKINNELNRLSFIAVTSKSKKREVILDK